MSNHKTTQGHRTTKQLEAGLDQIRQSPKDQGPVHLIVRRPAEGQRQVLNTGELTLEEGLKGDSWRSRKSAVRKDGSVFYDTQLNLMNARAIELIAGEREYWPLAGDQLYVDLDLSPANLPPGSRLGLGEAVIEVTAEPHLGCKKFSERYGKDAVLFVNSDAGKSLNLRGINAKVITPGIVNRGDPIRKL